MAGTSNTNHREINGAIQNHETDHRDRAHVSVTDEDDPSYNPEHEEYVPPVIGEFQAVWPDAIVNPTNANLMVALVAAINQNGQWMREHHQHLVAVEESRTSRGITSSYRRRGSPLSPPRG
ncbi:hypothetical protein A2U01_0000025 [Trifolium medium]|uniref:Uncharacterized protein n=1 Tax=Trifolium medium TaxID=97028 RepID=A0A392LWD7_9FABA|nr:hypothetical protein [Trifolium medium]